MQDKIIQITDTLNNDGDGETYGLSESGRLYRYRCDVNPVQEKSESGGLRTYYKQINHRWELVLESPEGK